MRIIAFLAFLAFVGGSTIPKAVHPNEDLIKSQNSPRIVNGEPASIKQFKWQASLQKTHNGVLYSHICGAAIISSRYALTAAHCVDGSASDYQIRTGSSFWNESGSTHPVKIYAKHESYNSFWIRNDIAILEFHDGDDIMNEQDADKITLASGNEQYSGASCQITGWGLMEGNTHVIPDRLQKADTTVISNSDCRGVFGSYVQNSNVCVHNDVSSACNGDSGGPLTCSGILVGLTSFGVNGCPTNSPSVYTRISSYRDWIHGKTGV